MLTRADVAAWDAKQVERAMRERLEELRGIRAANGDNLNNAEPQTPAPRPSCWICTNSELPIYNPDHDGRMVAYSERTITTSLTGFVGHGTDTSVENGQISMFRLADILTNPGGDRIRARLVIVIEVSTGTVRLVRGGLTCLGRA